MLDDMLLFVAVADNLSFSKAAVQFNTTKSTVSKRIKRLEKNLEAQLLNRTTRNLALTEIGNDFYARAAQIKNDMYDAMQAIQYKQTKPSGNLRIVAPSSFGRAFLLPVIFKFLKKYPDVRVSCSLSWPIANMSNNDIDLIITAADKLEDSSFQARKLISSGYTVCAAPEYFSKHGRPKNLTDLAEHNCLIYSYGEGSFDKWDFNQNGKNKKIKVKGNCQINSAPGLAHAALLGLGIAYLPSYLVAEEIKSGKLESTLDKYLPRDLDIYAMYPRNRYLTSKVRLFIDMLVKAWK